MARGLHKVSLVCSASPVRCGAHAGGAIDRVSSSEDTRSHLAKVGEITTVPQRDSGSSGSAQWKNARKGPRCLGFLREKRLLRLVHVGVAL